MEKKSLNDASANSKVKKLRSTPSVWTERALTKRLAKGPEVRAKFVASQISNGIAFQIRALRGREQWSQPKLAREIETTQNQIYRLENPAITKPNISTLKKIAAAFDVALIVRFVPFSQLVNWVSGTPFVDRGLSTESLAVASFSQETETARSLPEEMPVLNPIVANVVPSPETWLPTFEEPPLYLRVAERQGQILASQNYRVVQPALTAAGYIELVAETYKPEWWRQPSKSVPLAGFMQSGVPKTRNITPVFRVAA